MNPGLLDRRITVQTPTGVTQADGSVSTTWSVHSQPWARAVSALGARSQEAAAANRWNDPHVFTIRYDATITTRHRIIHAGQIYEIVGLGEEPGTARFTFLRVIGSRYDPQPASVTVGPTP